MKSDASPEVLDHVGIVVEDLESASAALGALLGVAPERRAVDGGQIEARVFCVSGVNIEVLRFAGPVAGVDPAVFQPGAGVQHLAFRVADLAAALERLREQGIEPLKGFPRKGVHGTIAFFREPATGQLLEFVQPG